MRCILLRMDGLRSIGWLAVLAVGMAASARGQAGGPVPQKPDSGLTTPLPRQDSKPVAGSSLDTPSVPAPMDASAEASPTPASKVGLSLRIGMEIPVKMTQAVDSGSVHNGDTVHGVLASPVRASNGVLLREGTRVEGTVVSSARAGLIASGGVLSLQVTHVGGAPVVTDIVDFNGAEGPGLASVTAEERAVASKATASADDKTRADAADRARRNVQATRATSGRSTPRSTIQSTAPQAQPAAGRPQ